MKTKKLLFITVLLSLYSPVFYAQDTPSTRIATSYEAETYYLYNKAFSLGRIGSVIANREGPTLFSNSTDRSINFAFEVEHDYYLRLGIITTGLHKDALLYADKGTWFRVGSNAGIAFWGNGNYKSALAPNLMIQQSGYIGINASGPTERLHLKNGNFLLDEGDLYNQRTVSNNLLKFGLQLNKDKTGYWLGTLSNHKFTIGTNTIDYVDFYPEGYAIFNKNVSSSTLDINAANKAKYSVFVLGGVLSEDYALGPRVSWADHVFSEKYELAPLPGVEQFIKENGHLPGIPSAEQVRQEGYNLHDMNVKLLEKVEELTLHVIRQEKEIQTLKEQLEDK